MIMLPNPSEAYFREPKQQKVLFHTSRQCSGFILQLSDPLTWSLVVESIATTSGARLGGGTAA